MIRKHGIALVVALAAVAWSPLRQYCAGGKASERALSRDLRGTVWVVTGGNTGIGFETAQQLAKQHATVVIGCRNATRAASAVEAIRASAPAAEVVALDLDLASFDSVRQFAAAVQERYSRLDGLVNNAGVMMNPQSATADGYELQFGTNHLGHFLLTEQLLPRLKASAPSRVVVVSSRASEQGRLDLSDVNWGRRRFNNFQAYADSKLANVLHARGLARRLAGTGVTAVSLHPGVVRTELFRFIPVLGPYCDSLLAPVTHTVMKSPWEGAQTTLHCALDEAVPLSAGAYFADAAVRANANRQASDDALVEALWDFSARAVGHQ